MDSASASTIPTITAGTSSSQASETFDSQSVSSTTESSPALTASINTTATQISARTDGGSGDTTNQTVIAAALGATLTFLICIVVLIAVFRHNLARAWRNHQIVLPIVRRPNPSPRVSDMIEPQGNLVHEMPSPADTHQELQGTSVEKSDDSGK